LPDKISKSDKSDFLSRQLDQYHHLRRQSLAVLRLLLALASVFVLSLTTDTVQNYIDGFSLVPQYLQNSPDQSFEILMSFLGLLLIIPALVVSTFAFALALASILNVFTMESLNPGLGSNNSLIIPDYENENWSSDYTIWVNKNNILLNKMEKSYRYGIILFGFCFLYLFFVSASLVSVQNQTTAFLIVLNGVFISSSVLLLLVGIYYIFITYVNTNQDTDSGYISSTVKIFFIIFGANKDDVDALVHLFSLILIFIQAASSIIMIWVIYEWLQIF
jgi:hypothetical protein